jgi:hypothetical protein
LTVVKNKEMSLRAASKEFIIPRATIQKRLKSFDLPQPTNLGRFKRIFTDEMESRLKQRVVEMEGIFYGMSTSDLGRIASGEKGRTVTIVAAVSATGQFIPPAMIFPRQRMSDRLLHDALSGTVGYCSGYGWIDSTLFSQYLDHFIEHVRPTKEQKVLLVLDNHVSHKSLEAIEKARANGIILLTLPPHTSSKLQPLDHTVFRALKVFYSQECDRWMINNMGKRITEYDIASILTGRSCHSCPTGGARVAF